MERFSFLNSGYKGCDKENYEYSLKTFFDYLNSGGYKFRFLVFQYYSSKLTYKTAGILGVVISGINFIQEHIINSLILNFHGSLIGQIKTFEGLIAQRKNIIKKEEYTIYSTMFADENSILRRALDRNSRTLSTLSNKALMYEVLYKSFSVLQSILLIAGSIYMLPNLSVQPSNIAISLYHLYKLISSMTMSFDSIITPDNEGLIHLIKNNNNLYASTGLHNNEYCLNTSLCIKRQANTGNSYINLQLDLVNNFGSNQSLAEVIHLVAPNGTGKSLVLKALAGGRLPCDEPIEIIGYYNKNSFAAIYMPTTNPELLLEITKDGDKPEFSLFDILTAKLPPKIVTDNKNTILSSCRELYSKLNLNLPNITQDNLDKPCRIEGASSGQWQKIKFIQMYCEVMYSDLSKKKLLMLDEPFNGLDPASKKIIVELLNQLRKMNIKIIITHHSANSEDLQDLNVSKLELKSGADKFEYKEREI